MTRNCLLDGDTSDPHIDFYEKFVRVMERGGALRRSWVFFSFGPLGRDKVNRRGLSPVARSL